MAQLKDSVVSGNLRVSDATLSAIVQLTTLRAPTTAGGTTYGPGTNGQVLKSNGSSAYWASDTDVSVTQTATSTDANYEVLFSNTADNTTRTEGARKNSNLIFNPSTGTLRATLVYAGGAESQSTYPSGGYHVYDCRSVTVTPAMIGKTANFYFHMTGTPDTSKWWSIMHVEGWAGGYSAWEIAGPSHNVDQRTTPLYVRTSNGGTAWGSWRKIYDTSNPPTASEVGASVVSFTQTQTSGTTVGTITINGTPTTLYAPTPTTNTDENVKQSVSTTADYRPIALGKHTWTTGSIPSTDPTTVTDQIFGTSNLYMKPSTGSVFTKGYFECVTNNAGLWLTDSSSNDFGAVYSGSNFWIGAANSSSRAHTGVTYISTGYDTTNQCGYSTIFVSIPNADNSGQLSQDGVFGVLHKGNTSVTQVLSSGTKIATIGLGADSTDLYAPTNTDTKVNVTLATTSKAYLLATTTAPTSSAQAVTSVGDTGVYLTTSAGVLHATTFEGSLNGTITVTETHGDGTTPTTQKTYYVPFTVDKQSTNYIRANDGIRYATYDGDTTASPKTPGTASLRLGNSKTLDDTGNMRGSLLLFGSGADYVQVLPTTLTAYRTIYFPDEGGTIALKTQADTSEMINLLGVGTSVPVDNDYYVSQYVNGGTTTTTYHRRSVLALWQYMKSKMTNGSDVSFSTDSTTKVLTISASNDKVTSTALEASTAEATYYPTFSTSSSTNTAGLNKISSFKVIHTPGTTSAVGNTRIILGNTTASGTANNEEGLIRLYSSGTSYHTFQGAATNASGGITHTFPATAGTVLNTGTTSYTATITSSTPNAYEIGKIKINGTDNSIYAVDEKVKITAISADAAEDTYYALFVDGSPAEPTSIKEYVHYKYIHTPGTASAEGFGTIALGNSITTGTLGNETGRIYLYSPGSKGHYIQGATTSGDRTHTLPATAGTILNTGTTSFTQTQTSGTKIGSIKINNTSTDIYSPQAGNVGLYSIIGTIEDDPAYGSHATCNWGGTIPVAALYDGLTIAYCLQTSVSPSANVTLNLKLSNGTYTGRINAYTTASSRITTHYGAGSTIILTYWSAGSISVDGTVTTVARWARADYNYNSDGKVTQSVLATTVTDSYPLLLSYYKQGVTTTTAQTSNRIQAIYAQPSTGIITANGFEIAAQTELDSKSVSGSNNVTLTNSNLGRYSIIMLVLVNSGTNDTYYRAQMIPYKWLKATFTNTSMKYHIDLLDTLTGGSAYISGSSALATQITIGLSSGSWPSGYSTLKLIGVM